MGTLNLPRCRGFDNHIFRTSPIRIHSGAGSERRSVQTRGFSLLEVVTALFIVGLMAGFLVPLTSSMMDANRGLGVHADLARVYEAVGGDPRKGTFGYVGDVGAFPTSLVDLIEKPAGDPPGWSGPYLTDVRVVDGSLYDAFGPHWSATTSGTAPTPCPPKRTSSH